MNMFETRTLLKPFEEGKLVTPSFLRDRYFSNRITFNTEKIDVDVIGKGNRKLAPFVHPQIGGKVMEREGYKTQSFEAPEISPERITTAETVMKRMPGEPIHGGKSPQQRAAALVGQDLRYLDEKITAREEWMCAQALFNGAITISGDGYNGEVISYWSADADDKPYTELATKWTAENITAKDIMKELRKIKKSVIQNSGFTPTEILCGSKVIEAILDKLVDAGVLDTRRVDMGKIDPQHLPDGVTYWGYLKDSALDIYSYDAWYVNDAGEEKPMVPEDKILMAAPNAKTTLAYGLVSVLNQKSQDIEFYEAARVPASYLSQKNPAGRVIQIKSRPLPIVHQVQAFHVIKAC